MHMYRLFNGDGLIITEPYANIVFKFQYIHAPLLVRACSVGFVRDTSNCKIS